MLVNTNNVSIIEDKKRFVKVRRRRIVRKLGASSGSFLTAYHIKKSMERKSLRHDESGEEVQFGVR
jgi:hypothetical protein